MENPSLALPSVFTPLRGSKHGPGNIYYNTGCLVGCCLLLALVLEETWLVQSQRRRQCDNPSCFGRNTHGGRSLHQNAVSLPAAKAGEKTAMANGKGSRKIPQQAWALNQSQLVKPQVECFTWPTCRTALQPLGLPAHVESQSQVAVCVHTLCGSKHGPGQYLLRHSCLVGSCF